MGGYETLLVVWGVGWMLLGTGMMYLIHRVMTADTRQAEAEAAQAQSSEIGATTRVPHGLAA